MCNGGCIIILWLIRQERICHVLFFVSKFQEKAVLLCPCCEDKGKVVAQCTTCDDLLCAPCYYAHLRSKPSKSHKVKILVDDIPASYNKRKGTQTEKPKMRPNTAKALSSNVKCKRYMGINLTQFKLFMNGLQGKS